MKDKVRGAGTLDNPFLGIFDSACNLLERDDNSGDGLNSGIDITIPADGVIVLAASDCCDYDFTGTLARGSYQLTINGASDLLDCGSCGSGAGVFYRVPTGEALGDGSRISVQVDVVDAEGNRLSQEFSGTEALMVR